MKYTAKLIADYLGGTVEGNENAVVDNFARIEQGKPNTLSFLANPKYEQYLYTSQASIIIISKSFILKQKPSATMVWVDDAYLGISKMLTLYAQQKEINRKGREYPSYIAWSAKRGKNCFIGRYAYISKNVRIGNNVKIHPHVYLGDNVTIGDNTVLYSGVKIYYGCSVGSNCIIHSNAVIGADGFGFAPDENRVYNKIPQIGNVIIEDDVEVGANTCIDRATMGSTIVRQGTKLDNLVQIAHNVEIGKNSVMAAQVGIAGSTKVGENAMFAGQVGLVNHLTIGKNVKIAPQSGITHSIEDNQSYLGYPALPAAQGLRQWAILKKLPDLVYRIKALEEELEKLKNK